ncbi:MAG: replicative DNA helicase [Bacteroidia bacterium]|nr:replicative DNA helicase [Bacteroidia bacterium]MDW8332850.1 replicative DNA helicase [Bacteroidia bacterium]
MERTTAREEPRRWERRGMRLEAPAGRVQPHAADIEAAVLGALMLEKDALSKVVDLIRPELFYRAAHRDIFIAIQELFQNSEPIDLLTVTHKLRSMGKLEAVGGPFYLAELTHRVAGAGNVEYHCHILVQKYILREIIRISGEINARAFDESSDPFDLLDGAEQELYRLSGNNLRRESLSLEHLSFKTIQMLEELRAKGGGVTGVRTGFKKLDEMTAGWQRSDLIIVAARPSMGKTAFTLALARNAAVLDKRAVAIFSLEMAATQLVQRLLCAEAELDAQRVRIGQLDDQEWNRLTARIGELSKASIFIDDTPSLTVYDLRAKCRRLKAEKNIELVIIDYLQLMSAGGAVKSGNREQEIAFISRSLKQLAKELDCPIIALSQLSRAVETRGGDKRPMLSDLRESGSIEQDADVVMFLYRPEYYGLTTDEDGESTAGVCEVIIGKQRNGPVDKVKLRFINKYGKFVDPETMPDFGRAESFPAPTATFAPQASGAQSVTFSSKMNDDDMFLPPF